MPGLMEMSAFVAWVALAYLLVTLVVCGPALQTSDPRAADLLRVFAGLVGLLAQATIGFMVGRIFPYRLTPLFMAVVVYSTSTFINSSPRYSQDNLFLPENLNLYDEFNRLNTAVAPAQVAWMVGLAAAIAAVWFICLGWSRWILPFCAVSVVVLLAGFIGVSAQAGRSNLPGVVVSFKCQGVEPVICMNPVYASLNGKVRKAVEPVLAELAGTPFEPSRLEQRPRGVGSQPSRSAIAFALDNSSEAAISGVRRDVAENSIAPFSACYSESGPLLRGRSVASADILSVVADRVAIGRFRVGPTTDPDPRFQYAARFDALPNQEVKTFLIRYAPDLRDCSILPKDLP